MAESQRTDNFVRWSYCGETSVKEWLDQSLGTSGKYTGSGKTASGRYSDSGKYTRSENSPGKNTRIENSPGKFLIYRPPLHAGDRLPPEGEEQKNESKVRIQGHKSRNMRSKSISLSSPYDHTVRLTLAFKGTQVRYFPAKSSIEIPKSDISHTAQEVPMLSSDLDLDEIINVCNTFWRPNLSFSPYKFGEPLVDFGSLWPEETALRALLMEGYQSTALRTSIVQLCLLVLRCGPLRVLSCMLRLGLIGIQHRFGDGGGMLHIACLAQNFDAIRFLCTAGINPRLLNKQGQTADQLCFCPQVWRLLPEAYTVSTEFGWEETVPVACSLQNIQELFDVARNPNNFDQVQLKLQTTDFNVNTDSEVNGDFLVHVLAKMGLHQVALLMSIVQIQGADIEKANASGRTPLIIATEAGDSILVDVLICVLGADPNAANCQNGWRPLHYAAAFNHVDVLNCLMRRGADFNLEEGSGLRCDDVALMCESMECYELVQTLREQRKAKLTQAVIQGDISDLELRPTDLCQEDEDGNTLLMKAVIANRCDNLMVLAHKDHCPINAQNHKNGMTALSIAASLGREEALTILMSNGASPKICDIQNQLPIHHAVTGGHVEVVDTLLQYTAALTGLQTATKLAKSACKMRIIEEAIQRRETEVVSPLLFECAMTGDADRLYSALEEGDHVNPCSAGGDWPVYLATSNGHLDVLQLLCQYGGDILQIHKHTGSSVLHVACSQGHLQVTKFLLHQYTKVLKTKKPELSIINFIDTTGKSALQLAADKGFSRIVELLLSHKATTSVVDAEGHLYQCLQYQGIQVLLEKERWHHTQVVMDTIKDRRAASRLPKVWLPYFDHHLLTKDGDTALMVACRLGRLDVVRYLLRSSVYTLSSLRQQAQDYISEKEKSLCQLCSRLGNQQTRWTRLMKNLRWKKAPLKCTCEDPKPPGANIPHNMYQDRGTEREVSALLHREVEGKESSNEVDMATEAAENPKEALDCEESRMLPLLHGGTSLMTNLSPPTLNPVYRLGQKVSHVCAVNSTDGATSLHRTIESGDQVAIVMALLAMDQSVANIQNKNGLSPLHLACKLGRRNIVNKLLSLPFVDLNFRTLEGQLPEEMTSDARMISSILQARQETPTTQRLMAVGVAAPPSSVYRASSTGTSSIDFEALNSQFEQMRQRQQHGKHDGQDK